MSKQDPCSDASLAFELAPLGLALTENRIIRCCNAAFAAMFGFGAAELAGKSLAELYPSNVESEHISARMYAVLRETGCNADERIMRHRGGRLFWCHVVGRCADRRQPAARAVWAFEDISAHRPVGARMSPREREVANLLVTGQTAKQIAQGLAISPRTVEAHVARLTRKMQVASHTELILRLVGINPATAAAAELH